tara:strand:+ start:36 stop:530 length:495 start_codon:yes stop_codon:yes gene_type:complete
MIIQCVNCNKKFKVDSSLIPIDGRNIQCGSCNHTWFFIPNFENNSKISGNNINQKIIEPEIDKKKEKITNNIENKKSLKKEKFVSEKKENFKAPVKYDKKSTALSLNNILSYLIVSIISFIAVIIILDTFKSPISHIYPDIELLLYNLFESIKDIILFIKDLLV